MKKAIEKAVWKMMSKEYKAGRDACFINWLEYECKKNPYESGCLSYLEWRMGYDDMLEEIYSREEE